MGSLTADRAEINNAIASEFGWKQVSCSRILKDHVEARGTHAASIQKAMDSQCFGKSVTTIAPTLEFCN